jgi:hypothetical protein
MLCIAEDYTEPFEGESKLIWGIVHIFSGFFLSN